MTDPDPVDDKSGGPPDAAFEPPDRAPTRWPWRRAWKTELAGIAVVVALAAACVARSVRDRLMVDDAFIAFRYAENLATGHGLVFNAGERVEGYTDFLWVILLAGAHRAGFDVPRSAGVLGAAAGACAVVLSYVAARRSLRLGLIPALASSTAIAASTTFAFWMSSGLETSLYSALLLAAVMLTAWERPDPASGLLWAGALFGLATLTRPEALALFATACAAAALSGVSRKQIATACLPLGALIVPHVLFRLAYYGYPLPNTWYAKTAGLSGAVAGIRYVGEFAWRHGLAWAGVAALGGVLALPSERRSRRVFLTVALGGLTIVALEGGDFYSFSRFCVPYWPLIVLAVVAGGHDFARWIASRRPTRWAGVLPAVGALAASLPLTVSSARSEPARLASIRGASYALEILGRTLRQREPQGTTIALGSMGFVPYFSGFRTIDMLGITDQHIAHAPAQRTAAAGHQKLDSAYVVARAPDLVIFEFGEPGPFPPPNRLRTLDVIAALMARQTWPAVIDVLHLREFRRRYAPEVLELWPGMSVYVFRRNDDVATLEARVPIGSDDARAQARLGRLYDRRGLPDLALQRFARALELDPSPGRRVDVAAALLVLGALEDGLAQLAVAEREGADGLRVSELRAQAYEAQGNLAAAADQWAHLAQSAPPEQKARYEARARALHNEVDAAGSATRPRASTLP